MVVDLPAPLGPRNPVTRPRPDDEGDFVDGHGLAVALGEVPGLDHWSSFRRCFGVANSVCLGPEVGFGTEAAISAPSCGVLCGGQPSCQPGRNARKRNDLRGDHGRGELYADRPPTSCRETSQQRWIAQAECVIGRSHRGQVRPREGDPLRASRWKGLQAERSRSNNFVCPTSNFLKPRSKPR